MLLSYKSQKPLSNFSLWFFSISEKTVPQRKYSTVDGHGLKQSLCVLKQFILIFMTETMCTANMCLILCGSHDFKGDLFKQWQFVWSPGRSLQRIMNQQMLESLSPALMNPTRKPPTTSPSLTTKTTELCPTCLRRWSAAVFSASVVWGCSQSSHKSITLKFVSICSFVFWTR